MIYLLVALLALAAGYAIGTLRAQRRISVVQDMLSTAQQEKAAAVAQLKAEQAHTQQLMRREAEEQSRQRETLKAEIKTLTDKLALEQSELLRRTNKTEIDLLLAPLRTAITQFQDKFVAGTAATQTHIEQLIKRTLDIGEDANRLTQALRANTKMQGNWGEGILDNLLQTSGLTPGRDYVCQMRVKDRKGKEFIPDVVVFLPKGHKVVIDAKVSLSAFIDYHAADTVATQEAAARAHVESVRRHIKELSDKHYPQLIEGAIGYVLMFVPSEAAYLTALQTEPQLAHEAYAKRVILLNPANLLMTLQLAFHLWQAQVQEDSVAEIYRSAGKIYDKFVNLTKTMISIEASLVRLNKDFLTAKGQLATGRGNLLTQLGTWKEQGLMPNKELDERDKERLQQTPVLMTEETTDSPTDE